LKYDLEDLSDRFSIETLVIEHGVDLEPSGQDYIALCPFHDDFKTKSLRVYPASNSFYCYGCHVGGSVFDFVMHAENVSFAEAVELLAQRAGLATSFQLETVNLQTTETFRKFRELREAAEIHLTDELKKVYFNVKKGLAFKNYALYLERIENVWRWYDRGQRFFDGYLIKFKQLPKEVQENNQDAVFEYLVGKL